MTPLEITCRLRGPILLHKPLALDSLLAAMIALRDGLPPALSAEDLRPIEIPVARELGGAFHLCSFSVSTKEEHERRWVNRRFPIPEAQAFAESRFNRIQINAGPCKSYRLPAEVAHLRDDELRWWCVGDADAIRDLLNMARYLGKRRAVGYGPVAHWSVVACEPWGTEFPVVRDGKPLRNLPSEWPGLDAPAFAHAPLSYPYDRRNVDVQLCAVP